MFFEDFSRFLGRLVLSTGKLPILSDLNCHVDEPHKDLGAARLLELLNMHNSKQHVTVPTHRTSTHSTRDDEEVLLDYSVLDPCLSDHFFVHCQLSLDRPHPAKVERTYRKTQNVDADVFCRDLANSALLSSPVLLRACLTCSEYHD